MNRQKKLALGAALLLIVAAVIGSFVVLHSHASNRFTVNLATKPRMEMQPEDSKEWLEKHFPGISGKDVKVIVYYRDNNEVGVRQFAPSGKLSDETVFSKDGSVRAHTVYAADGVQVIDGYELRADHTTKWTAHNDGKTAYITTMWYDGKMPFSMETRGIGSQIVDAQYFYKTGKPWLHYVGKLITDPGVLMSAATEAQVWANDGTKLMELKATDTASTVSFYHGDGTLKYVQDWETFPWYTTSDGTVMRRLSKVSIYSPDGKRVVRTLQVESGTSTVTSGTDYNDDGSRTEYHMQYWGGLDTVEKFDKDGKSLGTVDPKTVTFTIDNSMISATYLPDPKAEWNKQETNPSTRNEDGSPVGAPPATDTPPNIGD